MTGRAVQADDTVRRGRMAKAEQFAEAATHLRALLAMKTLAGYSHQPVSRDRALRAGRAMDALMRAARSTR